ncbi:MAG: glycosyltransferase family 39 protein [Acidobacteria bacterium]|nr:glycosyltransferase family 39 protein [Acidobacteriota bacterium]
MDDVDAAQAQIARNMLVSGDWVTARLDGIAYLEKPPLVYWAMAVSYRIFGVKDWAARIPGALSAIALSWVTAAFGLWAFGRRAGFYAGLAMATCVGLFLFTRIQLPDVMLTLAIALAMWALLRVLDEEELHPGAWAAVFAASLGAGLLLKSLIGVVFPVAAAVIYLAITGQLFSPRAWKRLRPMSGLAIVLLIAAPWHVFATLRNPPYFAWTLHSGPGEYHGFLWFSFINEQLLRFLNLRYPRDYNTVPRVWFWILNLLWLFPWSVYFPAVAKLSFKRLDRAGRTRLLALCWAGFLLVFFTFSTTQEYYSMPAYPAFALLLGSAIVMGGRWTRFGTRVLTVVASLAAIAAFALLFHVRGIPAPGDISQALTQHPSAYTLALGHMQDLTLESFAYLRTPLLLAGIAFLLGAIGTLRIKELRAALAVAAMAALLFHAARLALVAFDPYLSSRPLANALLRLPEGELVVDHHYYTFSSVFFYTQRSALLLNGRFNSMEYASYARNAPQVYIDDSEFRGIWQRPARWYLIAEQPQLPRFEALVGKEQLHVVATSGGKFIASNHPVDASSVMHAHSDLIPGSTNTLAGPTH